MFPVEQLRENQLLAYHPKDAKERFAEMETDDEHFDVETDTSVK